MNHKKIYEQIILKSKNIETERKMSTDFFEKHHIIPKSFGGTSAKDNIAFLTPREHYICHILLWKMQPVGSQERTKMAYAMNQMRRVSIYKIKINSKVYQSLKIEHAKYVSMQKRGNQYCLGKSVTIKHKHTNKIKRIKKTDDIPENYELYKIPYKPKVYFYDPVTDKEFRFDIGTKIPVNLLPGRSKSFRIQVSNKSMGNKSNENNKLIHNPVTGEQTFINIHNNLPHGWLTGSAPRPRKKIQYKGGGGRQVSINDVIYNSVTAAACAYNVSIQTVINRINHPKKLFTSWYYID